ncbi:MAG: T9SS type A sorting domain-containing protein [Flavobacteriales bacterium]|nr:T9SS type A sorting domain-containing protein [Flavobacteriales bacterium]
MKKVYTFLTAIAMVAFANAQDVAMDFTQDDCNGNPHHLFETLDMGNVVIIEFFMTNCTPCITAGTQLKPHVEELQLAYPGKVEWYHFGFTASYPCQVVMEWVEENGFPSVPFTDGSAQVAYYGGFGMPTIVVVGGPDHEVLFVEVGYSSGDDDEIHDIIVDFLGPVNVLEQVENDMMMNAFFNSATSTINLELNNTDAREMQVEIFSLTGQEVLAAQTFTSTKIELNAAEISNGMYIVKATVNGESVSQQININR